MELFLKMSAGVLISVVIGLILKKNGADTSVLLSVAVCCMGIAGTAVFIQPVISFCKRLASIANIDGNILDILLKSVGIGLVAKITELLCGDSGNQALGKTIQFAGTAVMLWLALPLLEQLIALLENILGAL